MTEIENIADHLPDADEEKQKDLANEMDELISVHGEVAVFRALMGSSLGTKIESASVTTPWISIRWILSRIIDARNPRLEAECMAIGARMDYLGMTGADLARKYGVTRALVNLRVVQFREQIGIPHDRKGKTA